MFLFRVAILPIIFLMIFAQFRDYLSETFLSCVKDEVRQGIDEN